MKKSQKTLLLSIPFILLGCVAVHVTKIDDGKVVSEDTYYPLSKERELKRWDGITPLHLAVAKHECGQVKKLLSEGANPFAKTISPTKGTKLEPIEFAYFLKDKECAYVVADYTLKHYKAYLLSHRKELITTLASLWGPAPLESLELTARYGYTHWAGHIMKKLLNTRKYQGKEGRITLARSLALHGYRNAMKVYYEVCPSCIREAFDVEIKDIENNWSYNRDVGKHIESLKYYRPYISASQYETAQKLIEKYQEGIRRGRENFRKMIASAFRQNRKEVGYEGSHKVSVSSAIRYQDSRQISYKVYYDGNYEGIVSVFRADKGYDIQGSNLKHAQIYGKYYPSTRSAWSTKCGTVESVSSLDNAIDELVHCGYFGRYR
ncbi:ankyrin repeat domain-containing protein [Nitratifractor sp.]|uniref:ankyrin repeat domain-containing protein n=1 Tax=Nitratifractor sp. TaxID=2268144 RepID=UPI0025F80DE1|nr:ankyrin repeat domain-containing protein [Nitratifractor sp.]